MKSLMLKSGVLSLLFALLPLSVNAAPDVGQAAPDFTLMSASGEKVSLKDYHGKTVVLEWTNHQCPFVVKHYGSGNMQALQKKWTDQGVVWLTILSSAEGKQGHLTSEQAMAQGKEQGVHRTHFLMDADGSVGKAYAAKTTPHMYVIDGHGVLQYMGAIDSDRSADPASIKTATNYIDEAVPAVMAGETPKVTKTRPYGCSVKYK